MSFNEIDEILDSKLNQLYNFIQNKNFYKEILKDSNFVRFQSKILNFLEEFFQKNTIKLSKNLLKNQDIITQNIKALLYYYFFLGLAYHYDSGRNSFITNIIEISKNQSKSKIKIKGFFNSNSNSIIIKSFDIIKNSLLLVKQNTLEKIKTTITNSPIKYETTLDFINNISLDFFKNNIVDNKNNFHTLIKTIVIKDIYQKFERDNLISIIEHDDQEEGEFRYITIVTATVDKTVDYNVILKMLSPEQIREGLADDIYDYILNYKENKKLLLKNKESIVDYLFTQKILYPITEEFLKYHKNTEKYQKTDSTKKDDTKAKYIISKIKKIKDFYSESVQKNAKNKLDVKNLFYTPLVERMTTLINQTEDAKILSKLHNSNNPELNDIINDMENITKYSYINFNNFSKDGIKIRPSKAIDGIRSTNLDKKNKDKLLETRKGNDLLDMNITGVMFLPENALLNFVEKKNLIEVDEKSPYQDFIKKTEKSFMNDKSSVNSKAYFWMFNTKKDELESTKYQDVSGTDIQNTIEIFLQDFYDNYYKILLKKTKKLLIDKKINSFENLRKFIDIINKKYAQINREPEIFNNLIQYYRNNIIKDIPITQDEVDNLIPNKNDNLINLPTVNVPKKPYKTILVEEQDKDALKDVINIQSICIHNIIWQKLLSMKKSDIDNFNQKIFDFVKKYVKVDNMGEYICKSCDEIIPVKKYVYEGTYVAELDTFMTTSIAVNQNLERIPKYRIYNRTIKNLDRLIERIGLLANFNILLGNTAIIKLRRRLIVKDILDMVLTHTDTLSKIMKNRKDVIKRGNIMSSRYGINSDFSKIFFFQLKDDIFLTSSEDTDKYKIIKYNNLITYLMLMIMLEINSGQILGIKETKFYNFYFYEKFIPLFSKLKIRLSEKEIISVNKIPLLAYTIYIFSGMIAKDGIWFGTEKKGSVNVEAQKEIIHSFIDLINSIVEQNFPEKNGQKKNKQFIYEIFYSKITNQIKGTFQDNRIYNRIKLEKKNNVVINKDTNKLQFKEKKHKGVLVTENKKEKFKLKALDFNNCYTQVNELNIKKFIIVDELLNDTIYQEKLNQQILQNLKKICARDNLEPWEKKLCDKYGPKFDKNLDKNDFNTFIQQIKNSQEKQFIKNNIQKQKSLKKHQKKLVRRNDILQRWEQIYNKENGLNNYLNKLIKNIKNNLGTKIKTDKINIHLEDDFFIIDHNYLGNKRKDKIYISESSGQFKIENNHFYFKNPVTYFYDTKNKLYLYYHLMTNQYIGYSPDKKKFQKITPNNYLTKQFSLKTMLLNLGNVNKYERILDYFNVTPKDNKKIINHILHQRVNKLKNLVFKANSIVYQIKYLKQINNTSNEAKIVNEFIERINNFNDKNSDHKSSVFKNVNYINNLNAKDMSNDFKLDFNGYIDTKIFNKLDNTDQKIIFYIIYELNKLLEYNTNKKIQSELSYLIVSIIKFLFETYYTQNFSIDVQKFYFLSKLIDEDTFVNDKVTFVGMYSELVKQEELDLDAENTDAQEQAYNDNEEMNALDVDDMGEDDDFYFDSDPPIFD